MVFRLYKTLLNSYTCGQKLSEAPQNTISALVLTVCILMLRLANVIQSENI